MKNYFPTHGNYKYGTGNVIVKGGEVCMRPVWLPYQGQGFSRQTSEVKKNPCQIRRNVWTSPLAYYIL